MENLFLREKIFDISSEAYLEDKGVEYLSLALIVLVCKDGELVEIELEKSNLDGVILVNSRCRAYRKCRDGQ